MENKPTNLDIYLSWRYDDQEISTMPELLDDEGNIKEKEYESFNIMNEQEWDPDDFVNRYLPELESTYAKYFNVFEFPFYGISGNPGIRFKRLNVTAGFNKDFQKILNENNLIGHRIILLHLIAEIFDFKRKFKDVWEKPEGIERLKLIDKELHTLELLKYDLHQSNKNPELYQDVQLKLKVNDSIYTFKSDFIIWLCLLHQVKTQSLDNKYDQLPIKEESIYLPYHNHFPRYFQNHIIKKLYLFLKEETNFPFKNSKIPDKLISFYLDFFALCGLSFYDSKGNGVDQQAVNFSSVKKAIQRAIQE